MRISDLDQIITLQSPTRVSDGKLGYTVSWLTVDTVWAKKMTLRSTEAILAMQTNGTQIHIFRIRYRSDVATTWRVVDANSTAMKIIGPPIDVGGQGVWLDIRVEETA